MEKYYHFYFHFTITGLPEILEPGLPDTQQSIETFGKLSRRYGKQRMIWRFDPIILSNRINRDHIFKRFRELASRLSGKSQRCIISFVQHYARARVRFKALQKKHGLVIENTPLEEQREIAYHLSGIAEQYGFSLYACCQDHLVEGPIKKAHCIDKEFFNIFGLKEEPLGQNPTRKGCGCFDSRDIGSYNTCPHKCVYCYANGNTTRIDTFYNKYKNDNTLRYKASLNW